MAFELPPWLTNFESPASVLSLASAAQARQAASEQAAQELLLRNRMAQEEAARQNMLAQIQLEGQRAQQDLRERAFQNESELERQRLGIDLARDERRAQESALMLQGLQDFQKDVAGGMSYRDALINNLGKLAVGDPSLLTQVKPEFVPGKAIDIGSQRYQGVMVAPNQMRLIENEGYLSPLEQERINDLQSRMKERESRMPPVIVEQLRIKAQGIMNDILSGEIDERIAKVDELYQKALEPVASGTVPVITTKEQYDSLPPKSIFIGEDGKQYQKP